METVTLKPLLHNGAENIGIYSNTSRLPSGENLNYYFQKKAGARWTRTHRCWYVPCTEKNYQLLAKVLKGVANLEITELKKYLLEKKAGRHPLVVQLPVAVIHEKKQPSKKVTERKAQKPPGIISSDNKQALQQYRQQLVLKSYSPSTIKTYANEFSQFLQAISGRSAGEITVQRLKDYMEYCHTTLQLSENTLHSRINALKFYYEQVLGRERFFWDIPRPKKPLLLPKVISKEKIAALINSIVNPKHKTIIMLTYGCGLRVNEVVSLKVKHIDGERRMMLIERAKGKKDRLVSLSVTLAQVGRT